MKYYLYILETTRNTLYCGITNDVLKRYKAHLEGTGAKYTRANKPKNIVYLQEFEHKNHALKEEYRIKKTLSKEKKLDLIQKNQKLTELLLKKLSQEVPS